MIKSNSIERINKWFKLKSWQPFSFQTETWQAYLEGKSGLIHSSTGSGKTFAIWPAPLIEWMEENKNKNQKKQVAPLTVLWLTPLRALASDTRESLCDLVEGLNLPWSIEIRTSDTSSAIKLRQKNKMPSCLITTPESLELLLSYEEHQNQLKNLKLVVVDEWHELLSTKRGTMTELALARLRKLNPSLRVWGMSATLSNLDESLKTLASRNAVLISSDAFKSTRFTTLLPDTIDHISWAGHLGLSMVPEVARAIESAKTTLVFTNTRSQCERWYQALLDYNPDLAGLIALHHGSLDRKTRNWVENAIRDGRLKCVVSTSSLDLGVDFAPVEQVIQIGSPKGVARLLQRAGRSGHQPGAESRLVCVPTHALELVEFSAAQKAIEKNKIESRHPVKKPLDVLAQHLVTLACGGGFKKEAVFREIKSAYSYRNLTRFELDWTLDFICHGGKALSAYDEYCKVAIQDDLYKVVESRTSKRHRLAIGTITSDSVINVVFMNGEMIGSLEESFISRLKPGERFTFAGRNLELVRLKDMKAWVRLAANRNVRVPRWMGGRMPLSSELSQAIRIELGLANDGIFETPEMKFARPYLELQRKSSKIPDQDSILVEHLISREGYHAFVYPFEGRLVHEGLAAIIAYRISKQTSASFSTAVNDYGFEILANNDFEAKRVITPELFSFDNLFHDILESLNATEMSRRQFREIARVAGLIFQGYPGSSKTTRQIQASSGLLYDVFAEYDPDNLLLKQAQHEVLESQLEETRMVQAMKRITKSRINFVEVARVSPLSLPLMVERLRGRLTSEKLADRIAKMKMQIYKTNVSTSKK
ncbi:MAG: ligase-associated DNA damage response DEXH box helicase [Cyanobacteria bacterium TGS_CYA1]|nr:ligase-associated DNA damage response DEXH box helicase [Cyanobacteria bacterium TGS_CYA1]